MRSIKPKFRCRSFAALLVPLLLSGCNEEAWKMFLGMLASYASPMCLMNYGTNQTCPGFPPTEIKDEVGNDRRLASWVRNKATYKNWVGEIDRKPAYGTVDPKFKIRAIEKGENVLLAGLSQYGFVFAHIDADPDGPQDKRYGIGLPQKGMPQYQLGRDFYIVVDSFKLPVPSRWSKPNNVKFARWRVFGVDIGNNNRFVQVGNTGSFRFCYPAHSEQETMEGSFFVSCKLYTRLDNVQKQLRNKSKIPASFSLLGLLQAFYAQQGAQIQLGVSKSSRTILIDTYISRMLPLLDAAEIGQVVEVYNTIIEDAPDAPAWMTCGVGCCIADL